jgi:hypothetical protein
VNEKQSQSAFWLRVFVLALAPLLIAGLYVLGAQIYGLFRYDQAYFSAEYQSAYPSPGAVAIDLEQVLRTGDTELYADLTGLRREATLGAQRPNVVLSILAEVDERDYFHYLYVDMGTYRRETYHVKEVNGRWIVSPEDAFFYFDSGRWLGVWTPIALIWWCLLIVFILVTLVSRTAAGTRQTLYGQ